MDVVIEPIKFNIAFPRGDTIPVYFTLLDENGNVLIPTEYTEIYFTLKKSYAPTEYVLQKRYKKGDIHVDEGECYFVIQHSDTARLEYGYYNYDIQIIDGDYVKTLVCGVLNLRDEATFIDNE